jgi:hypothetical protein
VTLRAVAAEVRADGTGSTSNPSFLQRVEFLVISIATEEYGIVDKF